MWANPNRLKPGGQSAGAHRPRFRAPCGMALGHVRVVVIGGVNGIGTLDLMRWSPARAAFFARFCTAGSGIPWRCRAAARACVPCMIHVKGLNWLHGLACSMINIGQPTRERAKLPLRRAKAPVRE